MSASACTGESDEGERTTAERRPTTSVEAEPESVSPPSGFRARPGAFSVSLAWAAPSGEPEVDQYVVYRNGAQVVSLHGSTTTYSDERLVPGRRYSYEIEAHAGELVSEPAAVAARTRVPPLRAARVQGVFNVRTRELSASGYVEHSAPTYGWRFRPRCERGPCDVRWTDLRRKKIHAVFRRHGARYGGTYTGTFNVLCGSIQVTSVVEIRFEVDAARPIAGAWRATRLVGTLNQSEAAQLGCVSSQAELAVRARLIR